MVGIGTRTTLDLDVTIKRHLLTEDEAKSIIKDILEVHVSDNIVFTFKGIEAIREEIDYPGYRVSIEATFYETRQTLKIDITTGDNISPQEIEYCFPLMFEDRTISILAHNLETILAEKLETIITRGITNTRMRDFYDIYILTTTQDLDEDTFCFALKRTMENRQTLNQIGDTFTITNKIFSSPIMIDQWNRYQKKYNYAADISWKKNHFRPIRINRKSKYSTRKLNIFVRYDLSKKSKPSRKTLWINSFQLVHISINL